MPGVPLERYHEKRNFSRTPEPKGARSKSTPRTKTKALSFVIQRHDARSLHYDFRLELDGVLLSWAVPKGPSLDPKDKRLAVQTEDHPLAYGSFEGQIPKGEYGAGKVRIWDRGTWQPEGDPRDAYRRGRLTFDLHGKRLHGTWHLVRTGIGDAKKPNNWLLMKAAGDERHSAAEAKNGTRAPTRATRASRGSNGEKNGHAKKAKTPPEGKKAAFPARIELELATLVDAVPVGDDWVHEIKLDGYRLIAKVRSGRVHLLTRGEQDWTSRFPRLVEALKRIDVETAIFDGEVVVLDEEGVSDFQLLQNALGGRGGRPMQYFVFDLLYLDGQDLRAMPLLERKKRLQAALGPSAKIGAVLHYCDHVVGRGEVFYAQACELGLEGVVSKRADRPYVGGRARDWLKTKCSHQQEFVIGGYTDPAGSRKGLGALLLGLQENGRLAYTGKVGTGFTQASLGQIHRRLTPLVRSSSPFDDVPRADTRRVHWVDPKMVAEVRFTGFTHDGRLRHPAFRGLRDDKRAEEVIREVSATSARSGTSTSKRAVSKHAVTATGVPGPDRVSARYADRAGVTNPDRVLYPDEGITKAELDQYFASVAPLILPHVAGRPLMLLRCPEGTTKSCFFQKHASAGMGDAIRSLSIEQKNGVRPYMVIDDAKGLHDLVQFGTLEVHVWGARADDIERPDRLVFDLDPGPDVDFRHVVAAARQVRDRLSAVGLESFVKTTGGRGLHVVLPITGKITWDNAKSFCKGIAVAIVADDPDHFVATSSKSERRGKIFIDYLRNTRGATAVAAYSPRARSGAPISMPLTWEELTPALGTDAFTVRSLPKRLATISKNDPWHGFTQVRQSLP